MAWEWVSPTATAAVGSVGVFFTWLTGKQGRDQTAVMHREQLVHARTSATEERSWQRQADTYVLMLEITEQVGHWAQVVRPILDVGDPLPAMPELERQYATEARVAAFASQEVQDLWKAWRDAVNDVRQADRTLSLHEQAKSLNEDSGINPWPVWQRLNDEHRPKEVVAREALRAHVNRELSRREPP